MQVGLTVMLFMTNKGTAHKVEMKKHLGFTLGNAYTSLYDSVISSIIGSAIKQLLSSWIIVLQESSYFIKLTIWKQFLLT